MGNTWFAREVAGFSAVILHKNFFTWIFAISVSSPLRAKFSPLWMIFVTNCNKKKTKEEEEEEEEEEGEGERESQVNFVMSS